MTYQQIVDFSLDIIFPIRCIGCGNFNPSYLCRSCLSSIKINRSFDCVGCNRKMPLGRTCYACRDRNQLDYLVSATNYKDPRVSRLIKAFKYGFISDSGSDIFKVLRKFIKNFSKNKDNWLFYENPLILPVPIHKKRYNWRGFNQSEILAQKISELYLVDFDAKVLIRKKETPPQAEIENREVRLKNPLNGFKILNKDKIKNRSILLIDDIATTGATLNECARVLKENGAKEVTGLVFAR